MGIELGMGVKDKVSGYCGIVTALAQYAYSADMALVENVDATNRPVSIWIEIERLEANA